MYPNPALYKNEADHRTAISLFNLGYSTFNKDFEGGCVLKSTKDKPTEWRNGYNSARNHRVMKELRENYGDAL